MKKIKSKFLIIKDFLRLLIKNFIPQIGDFLLLLLGERVNKNNWDKRILIIFGGGIGDVVKRSIICNFINKYLSDDFEIYYLMPYKFKLPYAKDIFYFEYTRAKISPRYYYQLVNSLRKIGFSKIVILLPFWENFLACLGRSIGAETIFVYKEKPPFLSFKIADKITKLIRFMMGSEIFFKIDFDKLIYEKWDKKYFPSDVFKMSLFISEVIKNLKKDKISFEEGILPDVKLETQVSIKPEIEKIISEQYNLRNKNYCLIGLGSSSFHKNWQSENFAQIADYLDNLGYEIFVVGGTESLELVEIFKNYFKKHFIDLINKTTLDELLILVKNSFMVISNDTSFVHLAIAFKKPSICVVSYHFGLGADSFYGYEEINKWVFVKNKSVFDVPVSLVKEKIDNLIKEISNKDKFDYQFKLSFIDNYF